MDRGGTDKNPMLIIETDEMNKNGSFHYVSPYAEWQGIQLNDITLKTEVLALCNEIDTKVRELHKIVNE